MQRALSTHLFVNHRLTTVWLERIWAAGIPLVEIFCAPQHLDCHNRMQISELGHWFRDSQLKLHSLHAPMYTDEIWGRSGPQAVINITEPVKSKRMPMVDEIKRALEIAEQIPFKFLIQHLGTTNESFDERKLEAAMTSIEHLRAFAKPLGVRILLENIPNELSTPDKLVDFIQASHFDDVGVCFDFGHAHMMSNVAEAFEIVKPHIRSTHAHDNAKDKDSHLWPGAGTINWKEAMELLRSAPQTPPLLLEIEHDDKINPIEKMQPVFDKLETA